MGWAVDDGRPSMGVGRGATPTSGGESGGRTYTGGVGLRTVVTLNIADRGPVRAASALITLPMVIFFVLVRRTLASGLTAGAVKD